MVQPNRNEQAVLIPAKVIMTGLRPRRSETVPMEKEAASPRNERLQPIRAPEPGSRYPGVAQCDPGQQPSQDGTRPGEQEGESIPSPGQGQTAQGQGAGIPAGGAGDEAAHGQAPAFGDELVGDHHHPGGVGAAQGQTHQHIQQQSGIKVVGQDGESQRRLRPQKATRGIRFVDSPDLQDWSRLPAIRRN